MSKMSRTVSMSVPIELQARVEQMMAQMSISNDEEDKRFELDDDDYQNFDVTKVLDHKIVGGKWSFFLRFKDGSREWIDDADCNCEELIREYLDGKGVSVVYLICRVSSKKQSNFNTCSLDVQKQHLLQVANLRFQGLPVRIKCYCIAESAYKQIPRVIQDVSDACRPGDTIMTYRVDRLSRNIFQSLDWLQKLYNRNVHVYSATDDQNGLWYHENRLRFLELLLEANKDAEKISKRVRDANMHRIERQDEALGSVPYGFRYQRELSGDFRMVGDEKVAVTKRLHVVVDGAEAEVIDRIRTSGLSVSALLRQFERQGLRKRGRRWNEQMIRRVRELYDANWRVSRRPTPPSNSINEPNPKRQRTQ